MGGNDKQGFPMKQGVMIDHRIKLLLTKGHRCYQPWRKGERKKKSMRGCIVDQNMATLVRLATMLLLPHFRCRRMPAP